MSDTEASERSKGEQMLNDGFFRSNPADYLQTRFELLLLAGGRPTDLSELVRSGVSLSGFVLGASEEPGSDEAAEVDTTDFVTVESQQLLHHAAETVLRLYLAVVDWPDSPWLGVAGLRRFDRFKRRIQSEFVDGHPAPEEVGWVLLAGTRPPEHISEDSWGDAVEGLQAFLGELASVLLDEASLYNSIKHGLGLASGSAMLAIDGMQFGDGPSVEYPESGPWDGDPPQRTWSVTTRWIDIGRSLGLTRVAIQMADSIWRIGRARYLGDDEGGAHLFFPSGLRPVDLHNPERASATRMSWQVVTEFKRER